VAIAKIWAFARVSSECLINKKWRIIMAIKDRKELFIWMLSNVTQGAEKASKVYQEFGQIAEDPRIKDAMEARAFVSNKITSTLNQCFKILGAQPVKPNERLQDVFVEDFRKELAEIQSPEAKRLFVLAKISHFIHLRIGEYMALVAAADMSGNYGVGVLLESCLADKLALADRTRRLIRHIVEEKVAEKRAA
jgi:ferritin-like metal-binding protein YciE